MFLFFQNCGSNFKNKKELISPIKVFIDKHWLETVTMRNAILWEKNDNSQF